MKKRKTTSTKMFFFLSEWRNLVLQDLTGFLIALPTSRLFSDFSFVLHYYQRRGDAFGFYRDWKATTVLNSWPDLTLVMVKYSEWSQVLTVAVQKQTTFSLIFRDGSYVKVLLDVWIEFKFK